MSTRIDINHSSKEYEKWTIEDGQKTKGKDYFNPNLRNDNEHIWSWIKGVLWVKIVLLLCACYLKSKTHTNASRFTLNDWEKHQMSKWLDGKWASLDEIQFAYKPINICVSPSTHPYATAHSVPSNPLSLAFLAHYLIYATHQRSTFEWIETNFVGLNSPRPAYQVLYLVGAWTFLIFY